MTTLRAIALVLSTIVVHSLSKWVKKEEDVPAYNSERSSWALGGKPDPDHIMTLTVAMRIDDDRRAELERIFWEVSDPGHPNYGKHRTLAELTQILAVPEESVQRVRQYFLAAGATSAVAAPNRDMITVTLPVSVAEHALNTTLHLFKHKFNGDAVIVRSLSHYSLPSDIADAISMVGDLMQFPRLVSNVFTNLGGTGRWPNGCAAAGCDGLVTPAVLAQRYKLPNSSAATNGNSMAVAEFQFQYYKDSDLSKFGSSCHRDVKVDKTVGGNKPSAGVESELDIEYIKAVSPEIPLTVIYSDKYSLLSWANQIGSMSDAPLVHSVSYGNDEVQQSSAEYMYTCNTAFMKAGARGLSILFASGDQGVCGRSGCGLVQHARFHPDFPAGSPYITAVGGTNFLGDTIGEEEAWSSSGGGFSDTFAIPDYQKDAVATYKAKPDADLPPQNLWNNTGRGYPDVAALGGTKTPYCVTTSGLFQGVAGTSASCPVTAGVFAKLNGLLLSSGKPPLGFLNPFIYKNPSAFQDVTHGDNGAGRKYGFKAVKGWDPATGWGTPDFEALSKVVIADSERGSTIVV